jgi:hypothetical protein
MSHTVFTRFLKAVCEKQLLVRLHAWNISNPIALLLKIKSLHSSETSGNTERATKCRIPTDLNGQEYRCGNVKSSRSKLSVMLRSHLARMYFTQACVRCQSSPWGGFCGRQSSNVTGSYVFHLSVTFHQRSHLYTSNPLPEGRACTACKNFLLLLLLLSGITPLYESEPSELWGFEITHSDTPQSVGLLWTSDQPVAETSTCQTHNTHNRQTSMPPVGFEPAIPAGERLET